MADSGVVGRSAGLRGHLGITVTVAVAIVALVTLSGHAKSSPAAVPGPQKLIDVIGVLRRPQTKVDLEAERIGMLRTLGRMPYGGMPDISLIRYATTTRWGERLYFIPFKPPTASELARSGVPARRIHAVRARGETLGVFSSHTYHLVGNAATIEAQGGLQVQPGGRESDETRIIALVPDAVAKVKFLLSRQSDRNVNAGSATVTAIVHDNIAAAQVNLHCCGTPVSAMIWYAANGRAIKAVRHLNAIGFS